MAGISVKQMSPRTGEGFKHREDLWEAQILFALALKKWFRQNGWPQKITDDWAKATESKIGPWASQVCHFMQGDFSPQPPVFVAWGEFNQAVAAQEFEKINDATTKERLTGAEPMRDDDGTPFTAADFFSLYVGLVPVPHRYRPPKQISDQAAAEHSQKAVKLFRDGVKKQMVTPRQAWEDLRPFLGDWKQAEIDQFQEVLVELHVWTGEEATALQNGHPEFPAFKALASWAGK